MVKIESKTDKKNGVVNSASVSAPAPDVLSAGEVVGKGVANNSNAMNSDLQRGLKGRHLQIVGLDSVVG